MDDAEEICRKLCLHEYFFQNNENEDNSPGGKIHLQIETESLAKWGLVYVSKR